ncbi:MAG: hypothetical protein QW236_07405, partial [Candidatus Bathyarchaeia archaeon]
FCGKTLYPHAKDVVKEIIDYLEGVFGPEKLSDMRLRVNVSGCPNDCGASLIADIGLVGKQVREGDRIKQAYDIYVGGGLGNNPSLGKLIAERVPAEKTKFMVASFIVNYLKRRKPGESMGEFCRRHRIEELKVFFLPEYGGQ